MIYYEACINEQDARVREKYLKSGMGKRYLKNRLKRFLSQTTSLRDKSLTGFTLIEMLVVIAIIAGLAALVIPMIGGVSEDAAITTCLNEMKNIKESIRDRFYPDLGLIPEDPGPDGIPGNIDDQPEFTTRYLCLKDDGGNERNEMGVFLTSQTKPLSLLDWDKYSRKGWRGPYMEQDENYEADTGPQAKYFPIITTPWANICEKKAKKAEEDGNVILAAEYRKGKYYQILGGQAKENVRIVCRGADGLIGNGFAGAQGVENSTVDELKDPNFGIGDDLVMFIFGGGPTRSPYP